VRAPREGDLRTSLLAFIFLAASTLLTVASVSAADPVNIQIMAVEEQPGQMILTVSAVDAQGKPFPGLGPSSFNAWINGQPLIVRGIQTDTSRLPASVLLLVDVSGSMAGEPMNQARAAIHQFIDALDPQDQVAVMSFASRVQLLQDFTADRGALGVAVDRLVPLGETALYDGVIQATELMATAPQGRKLIVLLSDGTATIGTNNRARSIQATQDSNVGVVAFGLGTGIDRRYLGELTAASGGRFLEASTPAALKQAYSDLASAIRSQYTLQLNVPRSIDRTAPGVLKVHVIYRADNAFAERGLDPLEGALPPPFSMSLSGLKPGDKPTGTVMLAPAVQDGIEVVKLDYFVDDNVIHTTDGVVGFDLDTTALSPGTHVIKIVATDAAGREGEVQVPFIVPEVVAAGGGASIPVVPLAILAMLAILGYLGHKYLWKRVLQVARGGDTYERVSSWASIRTPGPVQRPEEWPERPEPAAAPAVSPQDAIRGRVVVMDEAAVRDGALDSIREFEIRSSPLTFGSGPGVDMRVGDAGGLIAAEEARVWVQRGRLVYHKLTTLSAMATEGVTAGWQFLEDGDEMHIGPYRLIFQAQMEEATQEEVAPAPDRLPQEHGMALRPTGTDEAGNRGLRSWVSDDPGPTDQGPTWAPSLHDFNTPGQDGAARTWGMDPPEPRSAAWGGAGEPAQPQWGGAGGAEDASPAWAAGSDTEDAHRPPSGEDPPAAGWGVVEVEPGEGESAEWQGAGEEQTSHTWSFSDQTAASEWQSEPSLTPSSDWGDDSGGEPAALEPEAAPGEAAPDEVQKGSPSEEPDASANGTGSEFGSWQSGEWQSTADQDEDDEEQRAWGT
jgi:VWFA-related protein